MAFYVSYIVDFSQRRNENSACLLIALHTVCKLATTGGDQGLEI